MAVFQYIIGQEQICEHLQTALKLQKVSHAYIINGERNSGKKFIARIFAMALQCTGEGEKPCQVCRSCRQALSENHPDIIRVTHEKPNSISVDDIRTQVNNTVDIKPYQGPYKVYIIPQADLMTPQAQNAILKTIEEPPAYAVFLLLTENAEMLLPTINSRCVMLKLRNIKDTLIRKYLMENLEIPDYKADMCTAFAQGNVGKAMALASSDDFQELKAAAVQLLKRIHEIELYEFKEAIKQINEYKMEINDYLDIMMIWFRDILLYKATTDVNGLIFKDEVYDIKKQASKSSYSGIEAILEALEKAKVRLTANVNFDLVMELLLLTIKEN